MSQKPRVGVFKFTSCSGCQMVLVHMEEGLMNLLDLVDLSYFRMVTDDELNGKSFDIALVEGAITNDEEASTLKRIRKASKVLVAVGACAVTGGINAMKNYTPEGEVESSVYPSPEHIRSTKAYGLDEYVRVDFALRGCPVDSSELGRALVSLVMGVPPYEPGLTVCAECKMNGNECLFISDGIPCLGPVTKGGCGAICPSNGVACEGCRGPLVGTNPDGLASAWRSAGLNQDKLDLKRRKYASSHPGPR